MSTAKEKAEELRRQLVEAENAVKAEEMQAKAGTFKDIRDAMKEAGITIGELSKFLDIEGSKYSNAAGDTWSGKGKQPAWLATAVAAGKPITAFLTHKPVIAEAAAAGAAN